MKLNSQIESIKRGWDCLIDIHYFRNETVDCKFQNWKYYYLIIICVFFSLQLSTILSSCFPLFLCQLTDEFAAPTSGLTESHISHYDDSQTHSQTDYDILSSQYGIPSTKLQLITKNVYVHIPPDEPAFQSTQTFEKRIPKKHYNIIFIKG